jgi:carbamoyltransferase
MYINKNKMDNIKTNPMNGLNIGYPDINLILPAGDRKISIGFSVGHDKGAVLIINGKVIVGISEERLSRLKHDKAFDNNIPLDSINYCLEYAKLTYNDVDIYAWNTAENGQDFESAVRFDFQYYLRQPLEKLKFVNHHLAHAYSTFFSSGLTEAAVVVGDANGNIINPNNSAYEGFVKNNPSMVKDRPTTGAYWAEASSIYHFTLNSYEEHEKNFILDPPPSTSWLDCPFPFNMGHMYAYATMKLVYKYNEKDPNNNWPAAGAGKLMGLASFGNKEWLKTQPFLCKYDDVEHTFTNTAGDIYQAYPSTNVDSAFPNKANVAAVFQREQERMALTIAKRAKKLTGSSNICFSGGSFLNCNSNETIINSKEFDNCYFIPAADDSGIPLGCAWFGYQQISEITETAFLSPYIGKTYSPSEINKALQIAQKTIPGIKEGTTIFDYTKMEDAMIIHLVSLLNDNKVVGMHRDGSEIGPRALGNRSILASPIRPWMQNYVNHNIKNREWYRPFAPSVLAENVNDIFKINEYSPYMLITCEVKEEWRSKIPAVVHTDNTSRIQSVKKDVNPFYHKLISEFAKWTGTPVILNTSFNGSHEPIVETPFDAINTFWKCNLDAVCIGNLLIVRNY